MSVLRSIFAARGIAGPTGRPLFSYRLQDAELTQMSRYLRNEFDARGTEWGTVFCLFGAEKIRREYEGGPWRWAPIVEEITYTAGFAPLYHQIERGLRYLRRELLHGRSGDRQFWLTLMCEGGFPVRLLRRETARLTRFLRTVISEIERYPALPIDDVVERIGLTQLPPSLHNAAFLDFIARLSESVCDLRASVRDKSKALSELDARQPGWRDRIPIDLDDASARTLLEGLLASPKEIVAGDQQLALETVLLVGEALGLRRRVRPVAEVSLTEVQKLLALDTESNPPSRIVVQLLRDENELASVGVLTRRSGGGYGFRATVDGIAIGDPNRLTPIIFAQGSERLAMAAVPGSEALGDGPWVFAPVTDEVARLVSIGSYRAKIDRLLVAIPPSAKMHVESGDQRRLGALFGRDLFELRGRAAVRGDGKGSIVDTGSQHPARTYRLAGTLRPSIFLDREVFEGIPTVIEMQDGVPDRVVPRACIEIRATAQRAWGTQREAFGDLQLRVVEEGDVVFATRCGVVPTDFRLALVPSNESGSGRIRIEARALTAMSAASSSVDWSVAGRDSEGRFLDVRASTARPVELNLQFEGGGELRATTSFPGRLKAFIDRRGGPMAQDAELSVHALAGFAARCVAPPGKMPKELDLEARVGGEPEYVGRLVERDGIGKILELEAIRDRLELLLSSSEGSEDVRLTITERGGGVAMEPHITLRRYDARLVPEKHGDHELLTLHKMANAFGDFERLVVKAVPLARPLTDPETLPRNEDDRWVFRYEGRAPGPWLITGWIGDAMSVRPLCATVDGEDEGLEVLGPVQQIVHARDRRAERLEALCREVAGRWNHEAWPEFDDYLSTLGVFPSYTFDAVRALVLTPGAAILALLRAGNQQRLRRRWELFEELPMSWFMLPLRVWMLSGIALREEASRCADECARAGLTGDFGTQHFVSGLLAALDSPGAGSTEPPSLPPFVCSVRDIWCRVLADFPKPKNPWLDATSNGAKAREQIAVAFVGDLRDKLLARHAGEIWPQVRLDLPEPSSRRVEALARWFAPDAPGFQSDVLRTPIVAAAAMIDNHWPVAPALVRAVRRIRAFDEDWFDTIHDLALSWFVAEEIERDEAYLDRLAGLA